MRFLFLISSLCLFTSCFYGKVRLSDNDRKCIPQVNKGLLIFVNNGGVRDSVPFTRKVSWPSSLDHGIDRHLGRTENKKRPYYESYSTEYGITETLQKTIKKVNAGEAFIKYHPLIFGFYKETDISPVEMYYFIDGRWAGSIIPDTAKRYSLTLNGQSYNDLIYIDNNEEEIDFKLKRVVWSISYGLLRIEETTGNNWTVVN